jgi:hypothetical protein|tara:strand:+ start:3626 stop:3751 length:126 start_codon:yes stop_codon:yes gene_type:complete
MSNTIFGDSKKKKRAKKTRQGAGRGTKKKYNKYKGQGGRKR